MTASNERDQSYDAWLRAEVRKALADLRPDVSAKDVEAEFAVRRAAALGNAGGARSWIQSRRVPRL